VKRYRFRLERVLTVRRVAEDQAKAALLAARVEETRAVETLELRTRHYAERPQPPTDLDTTSFLAERFLAGAAAGAVQYAADLRTRASERVEVARVGWTDAHRKVDGLERLDARRRDEHALDAQRTADAEVDDVVVARYRANA
jgi:flagellar export protein FliJ